MDVLVDLLPASFTAKAEPLAKDSRQKQQQGQHKKLLNSSAEPVKVKARSQTLIENERRTGDERRERKINRGRWLESRDRNDRRENFLAIFVKI